MMGPTDKISDLGILKDQVQSDGSIVFMIAEQL